MKEYNFFRYYNYTERPKSVRPEPNKCGKELRRIRRANLRKSK